MCRIRNTGTAPVTVTVSLCSEQRHGPPLRQLPGDGGPRTLAGGESCVVFEVPARRLLRRLQGDGSQRDQFSEGERSKSTKLQHETSQWTCGDALSSARPTTPFTKPQERAMRTLIVATVCAGVLACSGMSEAAQISSASIFGGHFQTRAECVILNFGTRPVAATVKILNDNGQTAATSNCDGSLDAGEFCSVVAAITFRTRLHPSFMNSFSCVATAASTANLRAHWSLRGGYDTTGASTIAPMNPRRCSRPFPRARDGPRSSGARASRAPLGRRVACERTAPGGGGTRQGGRRSPASTDHRRRRPPRSVGRRHESSDRCSQYRICWPAASPGRGQRCPRLLVPPARGGHLRGPDGTGPGAAPSPSSSAKIRAPRTA